MVNKLHVKKGDKVIVTAGADKGKVGEILRVIPSERRVVVAGVAKVRRHTRPSMTSAGGIVEREAPIHASNVSHVDPKSGKATKVGKKTLKDGTKVRVAKASGETL